MNNNSMYILEREDVKYALIKLSLPAIIGLLINAVYNVVDTFFIGLLDITSATAAIAVVFPLFILISAIGLAFGVGSGTFVSRMLGKGNKDKADIIASTSIFSILAISILCSVLGLIYIKTLLRILGATGTIMPYAVSYSKILICGSIFTISNMTFDNLVRSEGNAKISMMIIVMGALINIILDPIFMFVLHLGLEGAAYATVFSQAISFILFVLFYKNSRSYISISIKFYSLSSNVYKEIFKIGIPVFVKQSLISISVGLINIAAVKYGDSAVAAMGITMRVTSMGIMVIIGFSNGFQPLAAFSYGAKNISRLLEIIRRSVLWLTIFCIIYSVILILFAKPIVSLFSNDIDVINTGSDLFRAFSTTFWFIGFIILYGTLFEALGKGISAFLLAASRQGLFFIPCLIILPSFFGLDGVIWTQPAADFLSGLLALILSILINKELHKIRDEDYEHKLNLTIEI